MLAMVYSFDFAVFILMIKCVKKFVAGEDTSHGVRRIFVYEKFRKVVEYSGACENTIDDVSK